MVQKRCQRQIPENKRNDAIECIYHIGKANTLALILQSDFGEDTKEERESMRKIKDYLQHEVLEKLYTGIDCGIGG